MTADYRSLKIPEDIDQMLTDRFKDRDDLKQVFLSTTKPSLLDKTPLSLLNSTEGIEQVKDLLYKLQTGDIS